MKFNSIIRMAVIGCAVAFVANATQAQVIGGRPRVGGSSAGVSTNPSATPDMGEHANGSVQTKLANTGTNDRESATTTDGETKAATNGEGKAKMKAKKHKKQKQSESEENSKAEASPAATAEASPH